MKVSIINHSDICGGAARAAYRIHCALRAAGVDSRMLVNKAVSGDWTVEGPAENIKKLVVLCRYWLGRKLVSGLGENAYDYHSSSLLPSSWPQQLNRSNADLVHLHWINGEMLSVTDLPKINKPLVWTLHDMWAFCGTEHYSSDVRWKQSYLKHNRPPGETGLDWNRRVWLRKKKYWQKPMQIVTPSHWLAECVRESALMKDWPVAVVPNAIDTELWRPIDKSLARELLGLPCGQPVLLFGAMGGGADPRKGFDLLQAALGHLQGERDGLQLVIFGQRQPKKSADFGFPVHYTGHLSDDISLRLLYSAADVLIIPSRLDNLPNTGVEAQACGTPVVAFDSCGLSSVLEHRLTGYLAKAFDPEDLARGICWVLDELQLNDSLRKQARQRAVDKFSYPVVAQQYKDIYRAVLERDSL